MALLFSDNGAAPAELPQRVRLNDGSTRTDSSTFTADELEDWGFAGPIAVPAYTPSLERLIWKAEQGAYVVEAIPETELEAQRLASLRAAANYRGFYDGLLVSGVYQAIRAKAVTDLVVTTACTEFIAAMGDAKAGRPNEAALQVCIFNVLGAADLSADHLLELQQLMEQMGLAPLYSLQPEEA